jgi:hypothetical protein
MPKAAQALKWLARVTVPVERFVRRTDQNCWKVLVPSMEGALLRWLVKTSYVSPSDTSVPFFVAPVLGL